MENELEIYDHDKDDMVFFASVDNDKQEIQLTCSMWEDEEESLYGDQVSATHIIGRFDEIEKVEAFDREGNPCEPDQEIIDSIMPKLKDVEIELETISHKVNYSPRYYDLI
ncbi:MAG: hypothetical protein CL833_07245 [Crocinitomicaceae bacterium]|nr:hypothetical protein [Crocinitomicaceae bacterium]|tara:strand:- start:414 stop:746 length:333 start_codon:yes stop_codon:yes gene_type:complete